MGATATATATASTWVQMGLANNHLAAATGSQPQASSPAPAFDAWQVLLAGLDGLAHGVAVFDAEGGLHYANSAARSALLRLGWLLPGGGAEAANGSGGGAGATAAQRSEQRRWVAALQRVCRRGLRELLPLAAPTPQAGTRGFASQSGTRGFASLVPVSVQGQCLAFLTLGRDELCGPVELQLFSHHHGLTLAESQVLVHLCRGLKANEIAQAHGVELCTVLTQISAIRTKTQVKSVRQLLDALARMPPLTPAYAVGRVG